MTSRRRSRPFALAATLVLAACGAAGGFDNGDEAKKDDKRGAANATPGNTDAANADGDDADGGTDSASTGGDEGGAGDDAGDDGSGSTTPGPGTAGETGQAYFTRAVLPLLEAKCATCHADPRIKVDTRGPLSIYSYSMLKGFLKTGTSASDNGLLDKVRNVTSHGGGNRCTGGLAATPCKELIAWYQFEMGDDDQGGGTPTAGKGGKIFDVSSLGRVLGWAADQSDQTAQLTVALYLDGAKGTGTPVGTVKADKSGADGNTPGDHAFQFDLPDAARNGKPHKLYAYVDDVLIGGAAFTFTSYTFTKAGRDYYEANVKGQLTACAACHTVSYEQQFYSMIAPSPAQGGTATNNQLINKPSQTNGVSHGGGQRCTSANAAPCSQFQQWWKLEFGG